MPVFDADEALVASAMQPTAPAPETPQGPPEGQEQPVTPDYREFDPRHKEAFTGLLYVGHLDDEFPLYGHKFRIATPTQTERLQIGPVIREYTDTLTTDLAWQAAMVAAYLVEIDGHPLPQPIFTDPKENALRARFTWVIDNLRRPVINAVSDRCLILESEVDKVLEAMGKASA